MDAAITSGDIASVDRVAAEITSELETGRSRSRWRPGGRPASPLLAQLDRVFVGFEKMTEAKRAAAGQGLDVARDIGQGTLEQSGAIDALGVGDPMQLATQSPVSRVAPAGH